VVPDIFQKSSKTVVCVLHSNCHARQKQSIKSQWWKSMSNSLHTLEPDW